MLHRHGLCEVRRAPTFGAGGRGYAAILLGYVGLTQLAEHDPRADYRAIHCVPSKESAADMEPLARKHEGGAAQNQQGDDRGRPGENTQVQKRSELLANLDRQEGGLIALRVFVPHSDIASDDGGATFAVCVRNV